MKTISDLRVVIDKIAASNPNLVSSETASILVEFSRAVEPWNDKTISAFIKMASEATRSYTNR